MNDLDQDTYFSITIGIIGFVSSLIILALGYGDNFGTGAIFGVGGTLPLLSLWRRRALRNEQ